MSYQRRSKDEWLTLINECRSSGLSDYDWCQRNGISHHTFYKAVRRLRASACEVPDQTGVLNLHSRDTTLGCHYENRYKR